MVNDRHISIPDWLSLDSEERWMLEVLRSKLREGLGSTDSRVTEGTLVHDPGSC
jgi:hypothetical protein